MIILALDTSGKSLSAALTRDGEMVGETTLAIGLRHSVTALPLLHDLCDRCGIAYSAIDAYACASGPGSYTGIRIGISMVKGMAYAAGKPAVAISTLAALAAAVRTDGGAIVVPMIDARSGRLFCSAERQGALLIPEGNRPQTELAGQLSAILQTLPSGSRKLLLVGDGAAAYADPGLWPQAELVSDAGPFFHWPRAAVIAKLAERKLQTGEDFSPFRLEASYLSPSQAERLRQSHE